MDEKKLFGQLAEKYIADIEAETRGVRTGEDIEPLHRMRVSLRRLKTALADFKETVPAKRHQEAMSHIRRLLRSLGQARDIDTKISFLLALAAAPEHVKYREGLLEIIDELREDRAEIQPRISRDLSRIHQRQVFLSIRRLRPSLEETGVTLDEWARNSLLTRLEKMFSLEPYVRKPGCTTELHEMRIAAKNLRYTLESLQGLYGDRLKPFVFAAMKVQRALGEVHNFDVWLDLVRILKDSAGREDCFRRAVRFLNEECTRRRARAYDAFLTVWSRLKKQKTWARLSYFILDRP